MDTRDSCLEPDAPVSGESMFGEHRASEEGRDPGPSLWGGPLGNTDVSECHRKENFCVQSHLSIPSSWRREEE